jgi:signal transduction histidine kinase
MIEVSVKDNGIGIKDIDKQNVFKMFNPNQTKELST